MQDNLNKMDNKIRLLLVGRTGSGRSSFGNLILQTDRFRSEASAGSVTNKCEVNRNSNHITIVDTPGLFHTSMDTKAITNELVKGMHLLAPGPHAFLYVIRVARLSDEEQEALKVLVDVFGEMFFNFCVIVLFTDDRQTDRSCNIQISELPTFYKSIIEKCNGRYVIVYNESSYFGELLSVVNKIPLHTTAEYYNEDMFRAANSINRRLCKWIYKALGIQQSGRFSTVIKRNEQRNRNITKIIKVLFLVGLISLLIRKTF